MKSITPIYAIKYELPWLGAGQVEFAAGQRQAGSHSCRMAVTGSIRDALRAGM